MYAVFHTLATTEPVLPSRGVQDHLTDARTRLRANMTDSARQNLAKSFVNAFVNAGFKSDKLMLEESSDGGTAWVFKNKDHGMLSAAASVGLLMLWDMEEVRGCRARSGGGVVLTSSFFCGSTAPGAHQRLREFRVGAWVTGR